MNDPATTGPGRFAPSPTSDLHLGNLRTALLAWAIARRAGLRFVVRIEDLDQARVAAAPRMAERQLDDLRRLGLDWDGDVVWQSQRLERYRAAVEQVEVYECFCTRRDIAQASQAPHSAHRPYPGTCRDLTQAQRVSRRRTRPPALRVRAHGALCAVVDAFAGTVQTPVDDFVVVRNDGVPAYNLAVVVDDLAQEISHVTRGRDLLESAPRQAWLAGQLGGTPPVRWWHVGLVVGPGGRRLAKRDGAATLSELATSGRGVSDVVALIGRSLGLGERGVVPLQHPGELLELDDERWEAVLDRARRDWTLTLG